MAKKKGGKTPTSGRAKHKQKAQKSNSWQSGGGVSRANGWSDDDGWSYSPLLVQLNLDQNEC
jgi:hypothetical protein